MPVHIPAPATIAARLAELLDLLAAEQDDPWPILGLLLEEPDGGEADAPLALAIHPVDGSLADVVESSPAGGACLGLAVSYQLSMSPFRHHTATHPGHSRATVALSHEDGVVIYRYPAGGTSSVPLNGRLLREMRDLWAIRVCAEEDHRLTLLPGEVGP